MIEYIIGAILVIITVLIILLIFRKRMYDKIDELEAWKIEVMNQNIASELSKIKELNLSGETQNKFEVWRRQWEKIVAKDLADVEEALFDAEEASDRFFFPKANRTLKMISDILVNVEKEIEQMLQELDQLLQAEKDSRKGVTKTAEEISNIRRILLENRYQFGNAERYYEGQLNELDNELLFYNDYVEQGEYTKAKKHVEKISERVKDLANRIEVFPEIYQKCRKQLPEELHQLSIDVADMSNNGFRINLYKFDEEIKNHEEVLHKCVRALENGEIEKVVDISTEIEERITEIYDVMEKEFHAKNFVESTMNKLKLEIEQLAEMFTSTEEKLEKLKATYYLSENNTDQFNLLEKAVTNLQNNIQKLVNNIEDDQITHLELQEQVEVELDRLKEITEKHEQFIEEINSLRKDELSAKEKLDTLRSKLTEVNRRLQTSNLPGVPDFLLDQIEQAEEKNSKVMEALQRHPLNISEVQHSLEEAKNAIEHTENEAQKVIEQCYLTEQVIQYANRYRSQYPLLSAKLSEAERLFREYEYELALEQAATAIEEIEPGALRRIEENQRYYQSI